VRAVEENAGDIGIFDSNVPSRDLWVRSCFVDRLVVVVPRGHPLANLDAVALATLLDHDLIGQERRSAVGLLLQRGAAALGRAPRVRIRVTASTPCAASWRRGWAPACHSAAPPSWPTDGPRHHPLAELGSARRHRLAVRDPDDLPPVARTLMRQLAGGGRSIEAGRLTLLRPL
jgi:DNA-binding transcriptional LysR family regulator